MLVIAILKPALSHALSLLQKKTKQNIKSKEIGSNSKAERENESGGKARDTIEFVCSWILW